MTPNLPFFVEVALRLASHQAANKRSDWCEATLRPTTIAHGELIQPVQKLVISRVVCLKDFHDHCAQEHSLRPLCNYTS